MTSPYIKQRATFGDHVESYLSAADLARDLCKELGATHLAQDSEPGQWGRGSFEIEGLTVYVRADYGANWKRALISCGAPALQTRLESSFDYKKFPHISVDSERPIAKIAADVRRRVIEAGREPLKEMAALVERDNGQRVELEKIAAALRAEFPGLQITFKDEKATQGEVYANGAGPYLTARLNSDGGLYVDRVGSIGAPRVRAFLSGLLDPPERRQLAFVNCANALEQLLSENPRHSMAEHLRDVIANARAAIL